MSVFWERKMKTYFMKFDLDHDGVLTEKDFELFARCFAEKTKADPERKEEILKGFHQWFQNWSMAGAGGGEKNVTMSVFIESMRSQLRDPEGYKKMANGNLRKMFDLFDVNTDGYLQKDEYRGFLEAQGVTDLEFVDEAFVAIDLNHDGKLSFDEFISGYFEFMFSDDEKNPYNLFLGPLVE